jgi:hypothetical protein
VKALPCPHTKRVLARAAFGPSSLSPNPDTPAVHNREPLACPSPPPPRRVLSALMEALAAERPDVLALALEGVLPVLVACREPPTLAQLAAFAGAGGAEGMERVRGLHAGTCGGEGSRESACIPTLHPLQIN